jgi:Uma2 family endonuclease
VQNLACHVLSPDDRFTRVRTKCQDYRRLGVPESWIFDPESRAAFTLRGDTMTEHLSSSLKHQASGWSWARCLGYSTRSRQA